MIIICVNIISLGKVLNCGKSAGVKVLTNIMVGMAYIRVCIKFTLSGPQGSDPIIRLHQVLSSLRACLRGFQSFEIFNLSFKTSLILFLQFKMAYILGQSELLDSLLQSKSCCWEVKINGKKGDIDNLTFFADNKCALVTPWREDRMDHDTFSGCFYGRDHT